MDTNELHPGRLIDHIQLAARHLPQSELTPATTHRYEWGQTGELLQASVWHHSEGQAPSLQSQALIERDALGRITAEVQRLYRLDTVAPADGTTDRRFNRMRPSIAPRKRHQAG